MRYQASITVYFDYVDVRPILPRPEHQASPPPRSLPDFFIPPPPPYGTLRWFDKYCGRPTPGTPHLVDPYLPLNNNSPLEFSAADLHNAGIHRRVYSAMMRRNTQVVVRRAAARASKVLRYWAEHRVEREFREVLSELGGDAWQRHFETAYEVFTAGLGRRAMHYVQEHAILGGDLILNVKESGIIISWGPGIQGYYDAANEDNESALVGWEGSESDETSISIATPPRESSTPATSIHTLSTHSSLPGLEGMSDNGEAPPMAPAPVTIALDLDEDGTPIRSRAELSPTRETEEFFWGNVSELMDLGRERGGDTKEGTGAVYYYHFNIFWWGDECGFFFLRGGGQTSQHAARNGEGVRHPKRGRAGRCRGLKIAEKGELGGERRKTNNEQVSHDVGSPGLLAMLLTRPQLLRTTEVQFPSDTCRSCGLLIAPLGYGAYRPAFHLAGKLHPSPGCDVCKACYIYSEDNPLRNGANAQPPCTCPEDAVACGRKRHGCKLHVVNAYKLVPEGVTHLRRKPSRKTAERLLTDRMRALQDLYDELCSSFEDETQLEDVSAQIEVMMKEYDIWVKTPYHRYEIPYDLL
ncbi:hypothetical protein DFH07DRAFT_766764 [Mycena maculata]|uniref:Uncharacterized protein n=1 Tax=Mycena maculata TaxID=230809 RepID=A0AAD7K3W8_9AGAR|nr:hypothetical protein DFH07DRAFT_766764 [Mycena maculata]